MRGGNADKGFDARVFAKVIQTLVAVIIKHDFIVIGAGVIHEGVGVFQIDQFAFHISIAAEAIGSGFPAGRRATHGGGPGVKAMYFKSFHLGFQTQPLEIIADHSSASGLSVRAGKAFKIKCFEQLM